MADKFHQYFKIAGNLMEEIKKDMDKLTKAQLEKKYEDFKEANPRLWLHILDGSVDLEEYNRLVGIQKKVLDQSSGSDKDKMFESSVEVGEVLARKYLYPIKEPSKAEKDKAYQQALYKSKSGR